MGHARPRSGLTPAPAPAHAHAHALKGAAMPAATPLLTLENLHVHFGNADAPAVKDVSLTLNEGEVLALVGESGSGKSVTVKSITRLIDHQGGHISAGRILLHQPQGAAPLDLAQLSQARMRALRGARIAMIFQDPMTSLNPVMTIGAQLLEAIYQHQPDKAHTARATAIAMLEKVRLTDPAGRMRQYPHELSGGMRQRVSIARALLGGPKLLLMDEPFGALDEITRDRLNEELRRIWQETGTTILFVTHSVYEALYLGEQVLVLAANPGRVASFTTVDLPRGRDLAIRETPQFVAMAAGLRDTLGRSH